MTAPIVAAALVPSESSASEQSRREFQAKLNGVGGLGGRKLSVEAREKKLRDACEGFESVFIQKMWQEMRNTIPKGGLMHGKEERFWQDMYDQELSKSMTSAGGIGLADMMYAQLSRNLVSASRSAAGSGQGRAFAPEAAPLINAASPVAQAAPAAQKADIYDGAAPEVAGMVADAAKEDKAATAAAVNAATAAAAPAAQQAAAQETVELNPEVERALAALRARQAMQRQEETEASATAPANAQAGRRQRPLASSGIELANVARREAGDKLGSHAVRPPLHQPSQRHSVDAAESKSVPADGVNPAQAVADAERGQQAKTGKVRVSTNMQPMERAKRGLKPIRVLNVDNVGANSKAGAGLAAYHAANEAKTGEAAAPGVQPGTPVAPQAAQPAAASANFSIPPLTAADARI